jgi:hypothetical protein
MNGDEKTDTLFTCQEAAVYFGIGITAANIYARIRRGSITAVSHNNTATIPQAELDRLIRDVDPCADCGQPATTYLIIKYHDHDRVEFSLCDYHANTAQMAYGRKGGVLEVVAFPLLGEGWLK